MKDMRTYFARVAGHDAVDTVFFARQVLAARQKQIRAQAVDLGFLAVEAAAVLDITLGDPAAPDTTSPVLGYVNAGEWKAQCECGGVEFVDRDLLIFMCCSCWNAAVGHAWRQVAMPVEEKAIEDVLLARPDETTRSWRPSETVDVLIAENIEHGLPVPVVEVVSDGMD